jgi:hypothetical protein
MEMLPKIVRQRLRSAAKPGGHPPADLLTAFAEKLLTERERTRVVEHLSRCEDCREVVFLSAPQLAPAQVAGKIPERTGWLRWPALRWGAAVAGVVVVGAAVTLHRQSLDRDRADLRQKTGGENAGSMALSIAPAETTATTRKRSASAEARADTVLLGKDTDENKFAARLETPARPSPKTPSPKTMTARPNLAMQFDQSRQINRTENGLAGSAGAASVSTLPGAPPAMLAKAGNAEPRADEESDKKQSAADVSRDTIKMSSQSEVVAVEASASPATKSRNPEEGAGSTQAPAVSGGPASAQNTSPAIAGALKYSLAKSEKMKTDSVPTSLVPRWQLTPGWALQRSRDAGHTWESVSVAGKTSFQALAAVLAEVWVGGANGLLYHSSDAGLHWVQVTPQANGESLSAAITHIAFTDVQNGQVTTADGESWTTSDAGKTWQKN